MKWTAITLLPLVATSSSFVILEPQEALKAFKQQDTAPSASKAEQAISSGLQVVDIAWSAVQNTINDAKTLSSNTLDSALAAISSAKSTFECQHSMTKWDVSSWLASPHAPEFDHGPAHPHKHRPHHGHHGHHGPHHKPNQTVYQLIASSKYTTKLASLINEYPDLVKTLNGTKANYTVFAPTDEAFKKIPHHGKKPPKELIEKVLKYHVSPDFYPAGRVLVSHTIPTALEGEGLGGDAQRVRVSLGLKGLAVNFYSRIVAVNIFGTNGVIHGVDSLLLPPPPVLKIIELLPGSFSTLQLALIKTGLFDALSDAPHTGGTFFAPSNFAFQKLGPKINAFLFSKYGEKYLKALLQYHVVANQTLYSDAFYKAKETSDEVGEEDIPKGRFHVDLPTLLEEKSLSIDIARWGGFITIKINGFSSVAVQDGIAKDGVIHVVSNLLIPPRTLGGLAWMGEELQVEDFKARFDVEEAAEREDL